MKTIKFYTTLGCHLCDKANALLDKAQYPTRTILIDIADNEDLIQHYSTKIPVLQRVDNQKELCWPFTITELNQFLK